MLNSLGAHWSWLLATTIGGAYFAFYVALARARRSTPHQGRARPDKDC
jgi:hypothetical protein